MTDITRWVDVWPYGLSPIQFEAHTHERTWPPFPPDPPRRYFWAVPEDWADLSEAVKVAWVTARLRRMAED